MSGSVWMFSDQIDDEDKFQNILNVKWNIFAFSLTHYCKSIIIVT